MGSARTPPEHLVRRITARRATSGRAASLMGVEALARDEGVRHSSGGFLRETFALPREAARSKAREWLNLWPKAAYMTAVETWRELPDGQIEFTMRRLPSAD